MIVELAVGAGAVVLSMGALRLYLRRLAERRREDGADAAGARTEGGPESTLCTGDVLLRGDEELWLAGALHLAGDVHADLFVAPVAGAERWVAELHLPAGRELVLAQPTAALPAGRIPDELRHEGLVLGLRARGRVRVRVEGEHLPPVTEQAELAVLSGSGGHYVVAVDFHAGDRLTLAGERVDPSELDHLPHQ